MVAAFFVEAKVRGYHVYKDIWTAVVGEEFQFDVSGRVEIDSIFIL